MLIRPYFHRRAWLNVDDDLLRLGIISTGTHGLLRDPRATTAAANKPTIVCAAGEQRQHAEASGALSTLAPTPLVAMLPLTATDTTAELSARAWRPRQHPPDKQVRQTNMTSVDVAIMAPKRVYPFM